MESTFIILGIIGSFIIGYQVCLLRWNPKALLKLARIQSKVMSGEIKGEDALKQIAALKLEMTGEE